MREIKFRGKLKNKYTSKWAYGYLVNENYINEKNKMGYTVINQDTVGQYTGLKDKSRTEIYEGDIVKIRTATIKQVVGHVEYDSEYCEYRVVTKNNEYVNLWIQLNIEVIGNVWDNPELLKAGD